MKEKGLNYVQFAKLIGVASPMTVYRYAKGLRNPNEEIMQRIIEVSNGLIQSSDFVTKKSNRYILNSSQEGGRKEFWERLLWDHLNGYLEREDSTFDERQSPHTLPVSRALVELKERVCFRHNQYYLDGRPAPIKEIIRQANINRKAKGLIPIYYPGQT